MSSSSSLTSTTLLTVAVALALAPSPLHADEAAAAKNGGDTAGLYSLKTRSFFSAPDGSRPPFWPIGFHPKKAAEEAAPRPTFQLNPDSFSVTSILQGGVSIAVINGRSYGEGEFLRLPRAPKPGQAVSPTSPAPINLPPGVRVQVARITDGAVILRALDQTVTVPLRRPELTERKPQDEELLLNE